MESWKCLSGFFVCEQSFYSSKQSKMLSIIWWNVRMNRSVIIQWFLKEGVGSTRTKEYILQKYISGSGEQSGGHRINSLCHFPMPQNYVHKVTLFCTLIIFSLQHFLCAIFLCVVILPLMSLLHQKALIIWTCYWFNMILRWYSTYILIYSSMGTRDKVLDMAQSASCRLSTCFS